MQLAGVGRGVALTGIVQLLASPGLFHPVFAGDPAVSKPEADLIERFVADARAKSCPGMNVKARPSQITKVALKGEGGSEFLVRTQDDCHCSPTGNCTFWVLVPRGNAYRTLLTAGRVQGVNVMQSINQGYPDLELFGHDSAFESTHWTYRFDGKRHRRTKCVQWNYQDERDSQKILREPRITPCS